MGSLAIKYLESYWGAVKKSAAKDGILDQLREVWTNLKFGHTFYFAPLIENSIFCPKPICLKFNLCVDTPAVGLGAKKECMKYLFWMMM